MAIAKLIIEDVDTDTGEVRIGSEIEGSLVDQNQMTAAELMIRVLIDEVNSHGFRSKVWAKVTEMIEGRKGVRVTNPEADPNKEHTTHD